MSERAEVALHPVRLRIVQALIGRPRTTRELADDLPEVPQASLYRHVRRLVDAGVLEVVDTRQVRGRTERTYGLVETATTLDAGEVATWTADEHVAHLRTFVATLLEHGERYLRAPGAQPATDGFGYHQTALWLDDDELAAFQRELVEVVTRHRHDAGPGRRRRSLATVLLPDPQDATAAGG